MRQEVFNEAKRIMQLIEEFDKMGDALYKAATDVKKHHNEDDAQLLARLIMKLVETKSGERLIGYIVTWISSKIIDAQNELREQFQYL